MEVPKRSNRGSSENSCHEGEESQQGEASAGGSHHGTVFPSQCHQVVGCCNKERFGKTQFWPRIYK